MTAQSDPRSEPDISRKSGRNDISRSPRDVRKPRRALWLMVLLVAMTLAGFVGVAVAANVTSPQAPTQVVYPAPNANDREGRVAESTTQVPNANDREDRVPATATQVPNANDREDRGSAVRAMMTGSALAAPSAPTSFRSRTDAVIAWNANAGEAATAACIAPADNPLHESRMYAMTHIAIHDAVNAIEPRFRPYVYAGNAQRGASADAAVAAAARGVMVPVLGQLTPPFGPECIQAGVASVEADYAAALAEIPDGRAKTRGIVVGKAAAAAIVALRADDGSDTTLIDDGYPQGTAPGEYRFTPDRPFAFAPGWADVTPFVLKSSAQFRPGPPYPITSDKYAADVNEIQALGGDGQTTPSSRTAEQTEIAHFWVESSPLAWNRIARTVARSQRLDLWQNARLFGLLNVSLADGYIGSFDTKYLYNYWRPVTAIREAATDGNPRTTADPTWTPLVTTPPIPDYDSAHSVQGGAAAAVLARVLGNRVSFTACSLTLPAGGCDSPNPVLRHFDSFSQAAAENAVSRIYVGFHFRDAVETGVKHGDRIGTAAVKNFMRPA